MKTELRNLEETARFNEDEYLVLIDDSLNIKALKGWEAQKRNKVFVLIPTKKKTALAYINLYTQQFDESKNVAYISLERLLDEYPEICDSKNLLSNLFANECKKDDCEEELLKEIPLEDVLAIEFETSYDPLDGYGDNADGYHFGLFASSY
jgi:hypothetical protein